MNELIKFYAILTILFVVVYFLFERTDEREKLCPHHQNCEIFLVDGKDTLYFVHKCKLYVEK